MSCCQPAEGAAVGVQKCLFALQARCSATSYHCGACLLCCQAL